MKTHSSYRGNNQPCYTVQHTTLKVDDSLLPKKYVDGNDGGKKILKEEKIEEIILWQN